jgi:hypothetical protein
MTFLTATPANELLNCLGNKEHNYKGLVERALNGRMLTSFDLKLAQPKRKAVLKFLYQNANIAAISLSFFTFGFVLGKGAFDLTTGEELTVLVASSVCGFEILAMSYLNTKRTALRARLSL